MTGSFGGLHGSDGYSLGFLISSCTIGTKHPKHMGKRFEWEVIVKRTLGDRGGQ